jgi:uncharacterized membrane protein YeaQ/YmgE (transglycosylase-associated protein family)
MSLLIALVVGIAVGGGVGFLLIDNIDYLLMSTLMGVVGSIVGLAFYYFLLASAETTALFNLPSLLCSVIGALIFVLLFNGLHRIMPKRAAHESHVEEDLIEED